MGRIHTFGWLFMAMITPAAFAWQSPTPTGLPARDYELTIDALAQVKSPGQPDAQKLDVQTMLTYALGTEADSQELAIRSLRVKVSSQGKRVMDRAMSRAEARFQQGDQPETKMSFEQAPAQLQKVLREFDTPLARLKLDARGSEAERKLLVDEDAMLIESGMIDNTRLFHPPFAPDQDRWEAPAKLALGSRQFARGSLSYQKAGTDDEGNIKVQVSGDLKAEGKFGPTDIKTGLYRVKGEQLYDPNSNSWVAGRLDVELTLELLTGGNPAGTSTGTMRLTLKRK
jgi:hypothetical protein